MRYTELTKRCLVAFIGIPLVISCAWVGKIPFLILINMIMSIALIEFYHLTKINELWISKILGVVFLFILSMLFYFNCNIQHVISIVFIVIVTILLVEPFSQRENGLYNAALTFFGILYIALLNSFILIREFPVSRQLPYDFGGKLVLLIFFTIWISDSAAYLMGSQFGKHPLFKRVSPHKTLEGSITGFSFALLTGVIFTKLFIAYLSIFDGLVIGVLIGCLGQLSDLLESLFKRNAGVKDSSNILPGHGGILDRFDSALLAVPIIYSYLILKP